VAAIKTKGRRREEIEGEEKETEDVGEGREKGRYEIDAIKRKKMRGRSKRGSLRGESEGRRRCSRLGRGGENKGEGGIRRAGR